MAAGFRKTIDQRASNFLCEFWQIFVSEFFYILWTVNLRKERCGNRAIRKGGCHYRRLNRLS